MTGFFEAILFNSSASFIIILYYKLKKIIKMENNYLLN